MRCPCKSRKLYKRCCKPWHEGRPAPTPEALMRSRYVAFALGLVDYAVSTSHPPQDAEGVRVFHENTRFLGLSISEHVDPGPGSAPGFVTFTATLEQGGQDASFTERSRFERRGGCWFYVGGERLEG